MDFFKVTSVEDTRELLRAHFSDIFLKKERVDLVDSLGRYTAVKVVSKDNVPGFDKSTVDGYAVKAKSTYGASDSIPAMFDLAGEVEMGKGTDKIIRDSEAVYVPTGGMIPEGTDAVVMIEYSEVLEDEVFLNTSAAPGENIIYKGEDIKEGDILLGEQRKIRPQNIGAFAAGGLTDVEVLINPAFSIISTGDEIKDAGEKLKPGQIRDINSYTLGALVSECGCTVNRSGLVGDDLNLLKEEIKKAVDTSDIVLLSGGSSVGNKDYTCRAIEELGGKILVHGVSIKPGKPTIIGDIEGKLVVGLPGHPVSAMIVFKALIEDIIVRERSKAHRMELKKSVHSTPGRTTYQPVIIEDGGAVPIHGKSGVISLLGKAFGYVIIPSEKEGYNIGESVEVWPL